MQIEVVGRNDKRKIRATVVRESSMSSPGRKKKPAGYLITLLVLFVGICRAGEDSQWGINTHTPTIEQLDICEELGVGWIRVDFNWADVEVPAKNQFDWGVLDNVVEQASARNIYIYGSIAYTPPWAGASSQPSDPPTNPNDWYDFVYACVSRYSYWVHHWGMWNEPNRSECWTGSWADYLNLILIPGHSAAKSADPGCLVLGPEFSDQDIVDTLSFLHFVMENASDYIDIFTQHSYGSKASDTIRLIDSFIYPAVQNHAPGKELWLTETGWRSDTNGEDFQALMYQEMCKGVEQTDSIKKVFFYELTDGPATEKWGIIRYPDNARKLAFYSYQSHISGSTPPVLYSDCFIATAVYGTPLAPEVRVLSEFRDKYLLTNTPGRKFVRCYYKLGLPIARLTSRNKPLGFTVRAALCPVIVLCRTILSLFTPTAATVHVKEEDFHPNEKQGKLQ